MVNEKIDPNPEWVEHDQERQFNPLGVGMVVGLPTTGSAGDRGHPAAPVAIHSFRLANACCLLQEGIPESRIDPWQELK